MSDIRTRIPVYLPMTVVLAIAAGAMVRTLTQHWREGAALLAVALIVAAVLRVVLPTERVGLLAIRSRVLDVLCYAGFAGIIGILALTIKASWLTSG